MKRFAALGGAMTAVLLGYLVLPEKSPEAADQSDGPALAVSPSADLADVYAFTNGQADRVNVVMTFQPGAQIDDAFDPAVDYVFHLRSHALGGTSAVNYTVTCEFTAGMSSDPQQVSCVLSDGSTVISTVTGDVQNDLCSGTLGENGCSGDLRVYTDVFDDPFFFNKNGFDGAVAALKEQLRDARLDDDGCPNLSKDTGADLRDCLSTDCDRFGGNNRGADDNFAGYNVQGIVIELRKGAIDEGGDILDVWASTEVAGVQVDRAGRPVIPWLLGLFSTTSEAESLRDRYDAASDRSGWNFASDFEASLAPFDALDSTGK